MASGDQPEIGTVDIAQDLRVEQLGGASPEGHATVFEGDDLIR